MQKSPSRRSGLVLGVVSLLVVGLCQQTLGQSLTINVSASTGLWTLSTASGLSVTLSGNTPGLLSVTTTKAPLIGGSLSGAINIGGVGVNANVGGGLTGGTSTGGAAIGSALGSLANAALGTAGSVVQSAGSVVNGATNLLTNTAGTLLNGAGNLAGSLFGTGTGSVQASGSVGGRIRGGRIF
uniref:Uncharacterized protein n=1 Tax=Anopheles dirus TaxID=7168 RepID=A0A182N7F0_9DIPT